jgi:integrase/recombinase XerC
MIYIFVEYIQFEKRQSVHSVSAYKSDLIQLQDFIATQYNGSLEEVNHQMLRSWIVFLKQSGLTNKSLHRKISSTKTFYKFLIKQGVIEVNPASKLVLPKIEKRLPTFIKKEETEQLLGKNSVDFNDFESIRNHLVLTLFYQCGIRLSELVNLKSNEITSNSIKVLGKRNKERIIPIIDKVYSLIKEYEQMKQKTFVVQNEFLIVKNDGEKSYDKFIYTLVNKELTKHTSLKKKSPHVLRHTFATHMLDEGADLNSIKELLGHSNLMATQVYTHNSLAKIKSIYKQAHPRAIKK